MNRIRSFEIRHSVFVIPSPDHGFLMLTCPFSDHSLWPPGIKANFAAGILAARAFA
jgi:hypothetical protein